MASVRHCAGRPVTSTKCFKGVAGPREGGIDTPALLFGLFDLQQNKNPFSFDPSQGAAEGVGYNDVAVQALLHREVRGDGVRQRTGRRRDG